MTSKDLAPIVLQTPRSFARVVGWRFQQYWTPLIILLMLGIGIPVVVRTGSFTVLIGIGVVGFVLVMAERPLARRMRHRFAGLPVARLDSDGISRRIRPATAREQVQIAAASPTYDVSLRWDQLAGWSRATDRFGRRMFLIDPSDRAALMEQAAGSVQADMALDEKVYGSPLILSVDVVDKAAYPEIEALLMAQLGEATPPQHDYRR